jgi:Tol biopolymer transport system component
VSSVGPADIKLQVLIQGLDVAPDGSFAVYGRRSVEDGKYASRLWRVGFERGARPERLTSGPSDASPRVSPDGRSLLFIGARGDDPPAPWILPLSGGEPAQVAEFPGPAVFADWSPDGTQILVLGASGDQRFVVGDPASPVARRITDLTWRVDGLGIRDQYMSAWVVPAAKRFGWWPRSQLVM